MGRHKKSKVEKLHAGDTVAQEMLKAANKIHKQLNPPHVIKWGRGS